MWIWNWNWKYVFTIWLFNYLELPVFFIASVVTWQSIFYTTHWANLFIGLKGLIFIKGHYVPQGKFVKPPGGINGHLMLYMAPVLPVCELTQGRSILSSTEFPSGPWYNDSPTGGLDFNSSLCIWIQGLDKMTVFILCSTILSWLLGYPLLQNNFLINCLTI